MICFWRKKVNPEDIENPIEYLADLCDTPEKLSAWLRRNIKYVEEEEGKDVWQDPIVTFRTRTGDCDDYAVLAQAVLRRQGYEAIIVAVSAWEGYRRDLKEEHAVCAFRKKITDPWTHIGNWRMQKCEMSIPSVADVVYPNAKICGLYTPFKKLIKQWVKVDGVWILKKEGENAGDNN
jgi:hypothetical protein